ncbi:MAG: hypothetical protein HQK84_06010 [Nitrospinae bacterium]|nr:hypothetical protein [Nitrospinota bacterium]
MQISTEEPLFTAFSMGFMKSWKNNQRKIKLKLLFGQATQNYKAISVRETPEFEEVK